MTEPVGILIPSLDRPQNLRKLIKNIHETAGYPHKLHFCVSDKKSMNILVKLQEDFIIDDGGEEATFANRVNYLYSETDERLFYFCGDDDSHYPGWLATMMSCLQDGIDVVVAKCNHVTLQRRSYIEQRSGCVDTPNVVCYPGYKHNFVEVEYICTANMRRVATWCPVETVEHHRWRDDGTDCFAKAKYDDTYARGDAGWEHDLAVFNDREHRLFPGARYW